MSRQKTNEILALYERDEKLAFRLLFDTYYIPLVLFANKIIQNEHSSEDIVQETLINFWQKKNLSNIESNIDYYLFKSVKNKTIDYLKSRDKRQEVFTPITEELERTEITDSEEQIEYAKLYQTIEQLPAERQKVFKLVYLEGLKYKEAADVLNISVNTVQTQLRRALQFLRENLTNSNESDSSI